jgi:hypothetical protein
LHGTAASAERAGQRKLAGVTYIDRRLDPIQRRRTSHGSTEGHHVAVTPGRWRLAGAFMAEHAPYSLGAECTNVRHPRERRAPASFLRSGRVLSWFPC